MEIYEKNLSRKIFIGLFMITGLIYLLLRVLAGNYENLFTLAVIYLAIIFFYGPLIFIEKCIIDQEKIVVEAPSFYRRELKWNEIARIKEEWFFGSLTFHLEPAKRSDQKKISLRDYKNQLELIKKIVNRADQAELNDKVKKTLGQD